MCQAGIGRQPYGGQTGHRGCFCWLPWQPCRALTLARTETQDGVAVGDARHGGWVLHGDCFLAHLLPQALRFS